MRTDSRARGGASAIRRGRSQLIVRTGGYPETAGFGPRAVLIFTMGKVRCGKCHSRPGAVLLGQKLKDFGVD